MKLSWLGPMKWWCDLDKAGMVNFRGRILSQQTDRRPMRSVARLAVQTFGGLGMYGDVIQ